MLAALRAALRRHPDASELLAYCDRGLGAARELHVSRHLSSCPSCERKVADLSSILAFVSESERREPSPGMLRKTLHQLKAKLGAANPPAPAPQWRRTVGEFQRYLGDCASVLALDCSRSPSQLLEKAGPLLSVFLGVNSAIAVELRIRSTLASGGAGSSEDTGSAACIRG